MKWETLFIFIFILQTNFAFTQELDNTRGLTPKAKQGKNYIFSIGIDKYDAWMHLDNAVNDANAFSSALIKDFDFEEILPPLLNERASRSNINNILKYELPSKLKKEDRLIIFYAGHGFTEKGKNGENEIFKSYLVPVNAEQEQAGTRNNYIEIADFLEGLADLAPMHISVFLDACNSGFALQQDITKSRSGGGEIDILETRKSRKVFTSAKSDQLAFDGGPIEGNSLYTGILVQGLQLKLADINSDEKINMFELAFYMQQKMNDFYPELQTPDYGAFLKDDRGEMVLRYNTDNEIKRSGVAKETTASGQAKKQSYTALAFRSYSELENQNFGAWIAETVIDGLSEMQTPDSNYEIFNPESVRKSDYSESSSYANFLKGHSVDRLFTGSYVIDGERLIIKTQIIDENQRIIYTFPDLEGVLSEKTNLLYDLKQRIKGYLDTEATVLQKLNYPPNYDAFNDLRKALSFYGKDHDKMRFFLDKAIEKDPKYFLAYKYKIHSYLDHFIDLEKAQEECLKMKEIDFVLSDYMESRKDILFYETLGDYSTCADLYLELFEQYKDEYSLRSALYNLRSCNRQTTVLKLVDANINDPKFQKNQQELQGYKMYTYLMTGKRDKEFDLCYATIKNNYKENPSRFNLSLLARSTIIFNCEDSSCIKEIEDLLAKEKNMWYAYLKMGHIFNLQSMEKGAAHFYNLAQKDGKTKELSHNYLQEINCRNGNCQEQIEWLEKNAKKLIDDQPDLNRLFREIEVYAIACLETNCKVKNIKLLEEILLHDKSLIHYSYYVLGKLHVAQGDFDKALKAFKKAYSFGMSKTYGKYLLDPDLKAIKDYAPYVEFAGVR